MQRPDASDPVRELLARARRSDAEARAALIERWQPRILARIRLMMGVDARRNADSVDFLNGVLVKVLERLNSAAFDDEEQVVRWMTAVARNDIRDHAGKHRERALESLSQSWHASAHPDSSTPSPLSHADREDRLLRLVECLEQLADGERRVIELRDLEGLTYADVGARLGWSDDRARLTHVRAMLRLGQLVGRSTR